LSLGRISWGSMIVLIMLPFCACLDVQSANITEQVIHAGGKVHMTVEFAPPTTEGWESGELAIGLLCLRMPAGWRFVEGSWAIVGGRNGRVAVCDKIRPVLEAGAEDTTIVLCSDQVIGRGDLAGDISAELVFQTGTKPGYFSLLLLGGATDANYSDVIWSNMAAVRREVTTN
jgi:hypothetical protein